MKPPKLPQELIDRFEKIKATPFSPETIAACNEAQRQKREREEQKQNEFIEISWIKLETENLWKPQNPEIKINPIKTSETIPQAWEEDWNWYYNFPWAQAEAEYLWKSIPTKEQWEQICEPYWDDWEKLSKELNMPMSGYRNRKNGQYYGQGTYGYYWSSSPNSQYSYYANFNSGGGVIINDYDACAYGFSVRCIKD